MRNRPTIAIVLGAGGMRGRAALGVLRRLRHEGVPVDAIVGVSAGAMIAAYHAGVGWSVDECIEQVSQVDSRTLLAFALSRSGLPVFSRMAIARAGRLEAWLTMLDEASFDAPRNGVGKVAILAFDLVSRRSVVFGSGRDNDGVSMAMAARGSAAVPGVFGPLKVAGRTREYRLVDGGLADPLPVRLAFSPPVGADRVIAVDIGRAPYGSFPSRRASLDAWGERLVVLRPRVGSGGTLVTRRSLTRSLVEAGESSVTPVMLQRIQGWLRSSSTPWPEALPPELPRSTGSAALARGPFPGLE